MRTIVCYGDSNTYGYRADTGGRFPPDERWPVVMAARLGADWAVIAEGLPGRTTVFDDPLQEGLSGIACLSPILRSHGPIDTLIVLLGTNDTKERFGASGAVIALGLRRLVEKAMALPVWNGKPDIVLVAPAPIEAAYIDAEFGATMGVGCAEKSKALAPLYQQIAADLGLRFFDADGVAAVHPKDYMHLTAKGQQALGNALAELVRTRG